MEVSSLVFLHQTEVSLLDFLHQTEVFSSVPNPPTFVSNKNIIFADIQKLIHYLRDMNKYGSSLIFIAFMNSCTVENEQNLTDFVFVNNSVHKVTIFSNSDTICISPNSSANHREYYNGYKPFLDEKTVKVAYDDSIPIVFDRSMEMVVDGKELNILRAEYVVTNVEAIPICTYEFTNKDYEIAVQNLNSK